MLSTTINVFLIVFIVVSLILSVWFCYQTRVMGELVIKKYLENKMAQQNLNHKNNNNNFTEWDEGNEPLFEMINREPPIK
uniref:Uncharacterized protein n=1 Tax=viral metagenome TaxID=1070528 RepID=A0A6C0J891_9ZZZZ